MVHAGSIPFTDRFCRAKEALAAKAKAEQELKALALQLETAVARAHECEEKERLAEDSASKLKVSLLFMPVIFAKWSSNSFHSLMRRLLLPKLHIN